jgi:hypothetical protein
MQQMAGQNGNPDMAVAAIFCHNGKRSQCSYWHYTGIGKIVAYAGTAAIIRRIVTIAAEYGIMANIIIMRLIPAGAFHQGAVIPPYANTAVTPVKLILEIATGAT